MCSFMLICQCCFAIVKVLLKKVTCLLQVDILWFFIVSVVLVAVTADVSSTEPQNVNVQVNVDSY